MLDTVVWNRVSVEVGKSRVSHVPVGVVVRVGICSTRPIASRAIVVTL